MHTILTIAFDWVIFMSMLFWQCNYIFELQKSNVSNAKGFKVDSHWMEPQLSSEILLALQS